MRLNKILVTACLAMTALSGYAGAEKVRKVSGLAKIDLTDKHGALLPRLTFEGRTYYIGRSGKVFQVKLVNDSGGRIEGVVAVDGRDVITGKKAVTGARGYIVSPYKSELIKGFRTSQDTVGRFKFAEEGEGYDVALGGSGNREGLVGAAIYEELSRPVYRPLRRAGFGRASRGGAANLETLGGGLSTEMGRDIEDRVSYTTFNRMSSSPSAILELRYGDADGLLSIGVSKRKIDEALGYRSPRGDEPGPFVDQPGEFAPRPRRGR